MTDSPFEEPKLSWMCAAAGCHNPKEGRTDYCGSCNKAQRKEERESSKPQKVVKPLKRTGYVKPVSDKRKDQNDTYSIMRGAFLATKVRCECCGESVGPRDAKEFLTVHHMKGRTNELLLDRQYWMAVCLPCHRHITDDSAWAIREGYSLPRNH